MPDLSSVVTFGGPTITAIGAYMFWRKQRRLIRIKQWSDSVKLIGRLRGMLSRIQQHRGLSNAWLNGDSERQQDIQQIERKLGRDLAEIEDYVPSGAALHRWLEITRHWATLSARYGQLGAAENIRQHNLLVANILYLMEDVTEDCLIISGVGGVSPSKLRDGLRWLELAEIVGQARAIGTGAAAAGRCDSVARIRLAYLGERIHEFSGNCNLEAAMLAGLKEFSGLVEKVMIVESSELSASVYYQEASVLIDDIYRRFDIELETYGNSVAV